MIIRVIAVDPVAPAGKEDLVVWQVPENSRALELLTAGLAAQKIEWTLLKPTPKVKL